MDEEDFDYVPSYVRDRQPEQPLAREFQPVDRGPAERLYKMFRPMFDDSWEMPDLSGPEYRQPVPEPEFNENSGGNPFRTLEYRVGRDENANRVQYVNAMGSGQGGGSAGKSNPNDLNMLIDPLGMFPQYGSSGQGGSPQTNTAPSTPRQPQELWDEHVWKSPEVINAQTPREKRAAVNRILSGRQGDFDAAYKAAFGDKAAGQWENDKKYTLNSMGDYVSADDLGKFGWNNVNPDMVKDLNDTLKRYAITTPKRIRHFLSQSAQETDKGKSYTEQNYGDKTYFKRMYEGRKELGNIYDGDGEKFRGGGGIHLTGRNQYQDFADYIGDPKVMEGGADYVATKYPWITAGRWWEKNKMNELVDGLKGKDHEADVDKVTDVVNRWDVKGRIPRKQYYKDWYTIYPD